MILSARKCGCPSHDECFQNSEGASFESNRLNLNQCASLPSTRTGREEEYSCGCGSGSDDAKPRGDKTPKLISEIEGKGMPYKEIEASFNDNHMVVRIQKERPPIEYDPPCDCIEPEPAPCQTGNGGPAQGARRNEVIFQKSDEGCRTISVYPHPDGRKPENFSKTSSKADKSDKRDDRKGAREAVTLPTVNPEENPNIFVLKIKRKCENGDKKHNLALEFRTPRPWSNARKK